MLRPSSRSPATVASLAIVALVSWTCTDRAVTHAEDPDLASTAGGEAPSAIVRAEELAADLIEDTSLELLSLPPIEPFEPVDEGVLGLRMPLHDPGGRAMHRFHTALRRAERGEGKARLAVYGASHVASDWFTGVLREELQQRFGDGGHGFVLPVHPWPSYRHFGVELESDGPARWTTRRIRTGHLEVEPYGYAGVAVESDIAGAYGSVSTSVTGPVGMTASSFELFYLAQPGGGELEVILDGATVARLSTHAEEATARYARYAAADGPHRLEVRVVGNGPVRIYGVTVERDGPGVVVDTLGINGARARYHLLWEDQVYRAHLERRKPDLVVLAYGTNEAGDDDVPLDEYTDRLREVVTRIRETVPEASCLLIGPSDRPIRERRGRVVRDRPRTVQLVETQRQVSEELGCAFFDLVQFMGGPMSMVQWVAANQAARDHIHFTRDGYSRLGDVLFGALTHGYGDLPALAAPADRQTAEAGTTPAEAYPSEAGPTSVAEAASADGALAEDL